MKLSEPDADLYFRLMWQLLEFVNRNQKITPEAFSAEEFNHLPHEIMIEVRNALYDNIHLIDDFVTANPLGFSGNELAIVSSWKHFVRDQFHVERYLKNHAIFISDTAVYAVRSLHKSFDEMILRNRLPHCVETILLPFKGKIIYDGFLRGYNVSFGGGIKRRLREDYMAAKQAGRIIESLDPDTPPKQPAEKVSAVDWKPALEDLEKRAKKLRGGTQQHPFNSSAFALIKASISLGLSVVENPNELDDLWNEYNKVVRALRKVHTVFTRAERYRD